MDSTGQGNEAAPGERALRVSELEDQLAGVAREIATLLIQPRYDEARLAELDVTARELRDRIRAAQPPPVEKPDFFTGWLGAGRFISGG